MDYLAEARAKFETAFEALKARALTPEILTSAQSMAHKIKGNAMMYGYPDLGELARDLEQLLKAGSDFDPALGQSITLKLLTKIDSIRSQVTAPIESEFESETLQPDPTPDRWNSDSIKTEGYGSPSQRPSVLLIHSDAWIMGLMANMLEPENQVVQCQQAHAAMAEAINNPPDLIILEQNLPDMSGLDVTRFIRSVDDLRDIPMIMIMSSDEPLDIVEAVSVGVTDCFENGFEVLPIINHARGLLKKTRFHVFIVDDDIAVRDLLRQRFETFGVKVDTASDGIEAIEYLRKKKPDLIVLDRMMPRLEGGAVLYQIQQEINLKSIPVMVVTAMASRDDVITWLKRGAIDYITKPFNPDENKQNRETPVNRISFVDVDAL